MRLPLIVSALLLFLGVSMGELLGLSGEVPVLDLTAKAVAPPWLRAPGSAVGGTTTGHTFPPKYELPLTARIQAVRPSTLDFNETFAIELVLRNTGIAPFHMPQSRDPWKVHLQGQKGRRTFLFLLRFSPPDREEVTVVIASTQSAETVPDSQVRLGPGESVIVLLPGDLSQIREQLAPEVRQLEFRVICKEWKLADDRYFIQATSNELQSENAFQLILESQPSSPNR